MPGCCREVGDGNINFVYILEGPTGGLCVKQALPYVRIVGESWPLTQASCPPLCTIRMHGVLCGESWLVLRQPGGNKLGGSGRISQTGCRRHGGHGRSFCGLLFCICCLTGAAGCPMGGRQSSLLPPTGVGKGLGVMPMGGQP